MNGGESREIVNQLQADFPDIDFEMHYGGQPLYHFLISVE